MEVEHSMVKGNCSTYSNADTQHHVFHTCKTHILTHTHNTLSHTHYTHTNKSTKTYRNSIEVADDDLPVALAALLLTRSGASTAACATRDCR